MRILSLSLDASVLDLASPAGQRQLAYFAGHEADVLVLGRGPATDRAEGSVRVMRAAAATKLGAVWAGWRLIGRRLAVRPYNLVTTQDALVTGWLGYRAARRLRVKLITQVHGDYLGNPRWLAESPLNRVLDRLGRYVLRHSDAVRCVSERIRHRLVGELGVPRERTVVIPIGSDLSTFVPHGDRAATSGSVLLFVGRLTVEKAPLAFCEVVEEAAAVRPDVTGVIIGEGPLRAALEDRIRATGHPERYRLLGHVPPAELASWYRVATCLVHPSTWEGWGMVMVEALACGCPVVTTDTGCAGEVVRNGETGLVVPVGDTAGLAVAASRLLADRSLRQRLSEAGPAVASRYSFQATRAALARLFSEYGR